MRFFLSLISPIILSISLYGDTANIVAASDLQYAFKEIKVLCEKKYPNEKFNLQFGSSGKALTQIQNGAPYDLYFSADMNYPKKLKEQGLSVGNVKPYALGRIGLMSLKSSKIPVNNLNILTTDRVRKIAIANPEHAPYGQAAVSTLKTLGLYEQIKHKLVMGENIQQAAQYLQTGAADAAIMSLSIAKAPSIAEETNFALIDKNAHSELVQGYTLLKQGAHNSAAKAFLSVFESPEGDMIMKKYGFTLQ